MDDPDAIPSRMRKAKWMWRSIEAAEKPDSGAQLPLADLVNRKRKQGDDPAAPGKRDTEE